MMEGLAAPPAGVAPHAEAGGLPPILVPETIVAQAHEAAQLPDDQRAAAFKNLRLQRRINRQGRPADALVIDDAIVLLVERGELELASELVTPSFQEIDALRNAAQSRHPEADLRHDHTALTLESIREQRSREFHRQLTDHLRGLPADAVEEIHADVIVMAAEPGSALDVSPSFWEKFYEIPAETRLAVLDVPGELPPAVAALHELGRSGLAQYAEQLLPLLSTVTDSEERERFLTNLGSTIHNLRAEEPPIELAPGEIRQLANYRDPAAAIRLARALHPQEDTPIYALGMLRTELDLDQRMNETQGRPIDIPETLTQSLPVLHEALAAIGTSRHSLPHLVGRLVRLQNSTGAPVIQEITSTLATLQEPIEKYWDQAPRHRRRRYRQLDKIEGELTNVLYPEHSVDPAVTAERLRTLNTKLNLVGTSYKKRLEEALAARDGSRNTAGVEPTLADWLPGDRQSKPDYDTLYDTHGYAEFFDNLGVPRAVGLKMVAAWDSFSTLSAACDYSGKGEIKDLTNEEVETGALLYADILHQQASALQAYCERFGTAETLRLHETFGIVNFTRATPNEFSAQLQRWEGTVPDAEGQLEPAVHAYIGATEDYNGAFRTAGTVFFGNFGADGSFIFEASTKAELSRIIVKIGERERLAGRNPETDSLMRDIVIGGHGAPRGVELSLNNSLDVVAYVKAMTDMNRLNDSGGNAVPNDYHRHIGSNYRIILEACSTGMDVPLAINISALLHAMLQAPVEAPPADSTGYRKHADGSITFDIQNEQGKIETVPSVRQG